MSETVVSFDIPTKDGSVVAVDLMNDGCEDILGLLLDEKVPFDFWIKLAINYYHIRMVDEFEKVLKTIIEDSSLERTYDPKSLADGRVRALNTLAGYYIEKYNKIGMGSDDAEQNNDDSSDKKREEVLNTINRLLTEAEQTDPRNLALTYISKGVVQLSTGDLDKAELSFDYVLTVDKENIPALLGRACIKYNGKLYKEALNLYEQCLKLNPNCPADVRLGLGLCHYQLGHLPRARQCFERVIELDPNNVSALTALSIMDINTKDEELLQKAVKEHLRKAYSLDPNNSMVLNLLGNHFFFKRDTDKTQQLAYSAYQNSRVNKIQAESCFNMARANHLMNNYETAFKYYYRITSRLWPEYIPARFGLGQLYIQRNDIDKAIEEFEYILKVEPENLETNEILGNLYAKRRESKKALKHFKKVLNRDSNDLDALLRIGEHERFNIKQALENLHQAEELMKESETEISFELYNNMAVHHYKLNEFSKAEENFKKALSLAKCDVLENLDDLEQPISVNHLPLIYNIARHYEATKDFDTAEKIYLKIAAQHPSYVHVYLRMGKIQQIKGNNQKAINLCKLATSLEPTNPTTWAFLGQTYLEQNNFPEAQKAFEYIIHHIEKNDVYALLGMGNIYFRSLRVSAKSEKNNEKELKEQARVEKNLDYACQFFEKTLKLDGANLYGALNSGCVLCENGYIEDGKALLLRVREVCVGDHNELKDTPETYINLGHLAMIQKQYNQAEKYYSACSKRFFNDENNLVLAYLAKSYFDGNKYDLCLETLNKIDSKEPNNLTTRYNIAITYYEKVINILNLKTKDIQHAKQAEEYLEKSLSIFKNIAEQAPSQKKSAEYSVADTVVTHKAKEFVTNGEAKAREKLAKYREKAEKEELNKLDMQRKQEEAFRILEESNRQQMEREEREKRQKEERMKELYMQNQAIFDKVIKSTATEEHEDEDEEKRTKKRKKNRDLDESNVGEEETEAATPKKKKKSKEPKEKKTKEKKDKTKKKSRLKKKAQSEEEEKEDEDEILRDYEAPASSSKKTVDSDDEYTGSRPSAEGEEEFSFDNE